MGSSPIPVMSPTGDVHLLPTEQVNSALAAGGRLATRMIDPDGFPRYVPAEQADIAQRQRGTPVNADGSFTVTPAPGESFAQTMQRAAAAGQHAVSSELIQQQTRRGIKDAPLALGAAAVAGPVILGAEAGAGSLFGPSANTVGELAESGTNASLARQGLTYAATKGAEFLASPIGKGLVQGLGAAGGAAAAAKYLKLAKYLGLHD